MRRSTHNLGLTRMLLVVAGILFAHTAAFAQPLSMAIDPARFEFVTSAGDTISATVVFSNGTDSPSPIHLEGADFRPVGEDGKIAVGQVPDDGRSLKNWLVPRVTDLVAPGNAKTPIDFAIRVPSDAKPGAYWGVLLLMDQGQFHLAPIMLVNVAGDAPEGLTVAGIAGATSATGSLTLVARLRNDGALYEKATVAVVVRNILGTAVAEAEAPAENVLPGSIRRFAISAGSGLWPGAYVATVTATYGAEKHRATGRTVVWVRPFALLGVGLLLLGVWVIYRFAISFRG
jgi:hypothetical protein